MSEYEVFSNPNLLSHLAKHLHHPSCTIAQEGSTYYLHSSDIDYLCSPNRGKSKRRFEGLLSVLSLRSSVSGVSTYDEMTCLEGLLFILNGGIKLKYREYFGLARVFGTPVHSGTPGIIKREQGIKVATKDITVLGKVQAPPEHFRGADKQSPTMRRIWRIARRTPPVARALFYFAHQEDVVNNLRKVLEEIMMDTYKGSLPPSGKPGFKSWINQGWTEPEVGKTKMEDIVAWIHNSDLSGDKALHSEAYVDKKQATVVKSHGIITFSDVTDTIHTLLIKWISQQ